MNENCVYHIPDYIIDIFWVFVTVALLTAIGAIIVSVSNYLLELYQDRRESYLRNKRAKLELEHYAKKQGE